MNLPGAPSWLYWVVATATAAVTLTVFAYGNFTTSKEFGGFQADIMHRLDRMEEKIDHIIEMDRQSDD